MQHLVQQLQATFQFLTAVVENPNLTWHDKYSQVFCEHGSTRVHSLFKQLNLSFDYCDPDTGYQQDAMAFYDALKERMVKLEPLWPAYAHLENAEVTATLVQGLEKSIAMVEEMMLGGLTREGLIALVEGNLRPARAALARAQQSSGA